MEYKKSLGWKGHLKVTQVMSDLCNVIHICQISDSHGCAVRKMFYCFLLTVVQNTP